MIPAPVPLAWGSLLRLQPPPRRDPWSACQIWGACLLGGPPVARHLGSCSLRLPPIRLPSRLESPSLLGSSPRWSGEFKRRVRLPGRVFRRRGEGCSGFRAAREGKIPGSRVLPGKTPGRVRGAVIALIEDRRIHSGDGRRGSAGCGQRGSAHPSATSFSPSYPARAGPRDQPRAAPAGSPPARFSTQEMDRFFRP